MRSANIGSMRCSTKKTKTASQVGSMRINREHFHHGCTQVGNWNDPWQVQNCELERLADLATEREDVQNTIANYLAACSPWASTVFASMLRSTSPRAISTPF